MQITTYTQGESQVKGTFFELADEEYIQVEENPDSAVVLWSSTASLAHTLERFAAVLGAASTDDEEAYVGILGGQQIMPTSAQAEYLARADPGVIGLFTAVYGNTNVGWRRERVKLKGGIRPLAECSLLGDDIAVDTLVKLITATGVVMRFARHFK
jgi:hypothetical protein